MKIVKDEEQVNKEDYSVSISTPVNEITEEQLNALIKKEMDEQARTKFLNYAVKLQMLTKNQWFTLTKHQKLFRSPKAESAQILYTLFTLKLLAMRKKEGTTVAEYKVDLNKETQLKCVEDNIKNLKKQLVYLIKESNSLKQK